MAQYKAIYHRYDGTNWHQFYFATTADMVAETTSLKVLTAAERTAIATYLQTFQTESVNDASVAGKLVQTNAQGKISAAQIAGGLPYMASANPSFTGTMTGSGTGMAILPGGVRRVSGGDERIDFASGNIKLYTDTVLSVTVESASNKVDVHGLRIEGLGAPLNNTDAATKLYVDTVATENASPKLPVKAATTANITLSGAQTIDGVSIVAGDRVLVKNQTTASQNGIYTASASTWTKVTADSHKSALVFVEQGTTQNDWKYYAESDTSWIAFSKTDTITAGTGLTKSGTEISIANQGVSNAQIHNSAAIAVTKLATFQPPVDLDISTPAVPANTTLSNHVSYLYQVMKELKGTTYWNTGTETISSLSTKNKIYASASVHPTTQAPVAGSPYISGDVYLERLYTV
jgi:hypothetical protein